jgi:hypothetical protein
MEERMTTITLPPEIAKPLVEEARRRGTTPERLALETLRSRFVAPSPPSADHPGSSLADFLADQVGLVEGAKEAYSEHCGDRFAEGLAGIESREGS